MTPSPMTLIFAVLALFVLALLLVLAKDKRRRGSKRMDDIAHKLAKFDQVEVAQLADRWQECAESIKISNLEIMDTLRRIGLDDMWDIVSEISASVQEINCRAEQQELQKLINAITEEALKFRIGITLAQMEDFIEDVPHLHALRSIWQYQNVVDMYYQVITEVRPALAEQLESMV
jgi:hypothetical protein